jgi:hypothetical protein
VYKAKQAVIKIYQVSSICFQPSILSCRPTGYNRKPQSIEAPTMNARFPNLACACGTCYHSTASSPQPTSRGCKKQKNYAALMSTKLNRHCVPSGGEAFRHWWPVEWFTKCCTPESLNLPVCTQVYRTSLLVALQNSSTNCRFPTVSRWL